jgi:transaldolase
MNSNPLQQLQSFGQEVWLDYIQRSLIISGQLKKLIDEDGLSGMTSNPTLFEKAIVHSSEYDEQLKRMAQTENPEQEYLDLVVQDIQDAADVFYPLYESTQGEKGFVSLEVSPHLAFETEKTVAQVRDFSQRVNRPNVFFKIPATKPGLGAITQCIAQGFPINVTLIFSLKRYEEVANAYIAGLEQLAQKGKPLNKVPSAASVFISRIDTLVDKHLAENGNTQLQGKVAIANAKLIYQKFKDIFGSQRFNALRAKGARVQKPLWASTGTKNPNYSDVIYVEELIGSNTINTMPLSTMDAFRDHGNVRLSIEAHLSSARQVMLELASLDIDLEELSHELEAQGVASFIQAYDALLHALENKKQKV